MSFHWRSYDYPLQERMDWMRWLLPWAMVESTGDGRLIVVPRHEEA